MPKNHPPSKGRTPPRVDCAHEHLCSGARCHCSGLKKNTILRQQPAGLQDCVIASGLPVLTPGILADAFKGLQVAAPEPEFPLKDRTSIGDFEIASVARGHLKIALAAKKQEKKLDVNGVPLMPVGRCVNISFALHEDQEWLRAVFADVYRGFRLGPTEYPTCSSGRKSSKRIAIPTFNGHAYHFHVMELDLFYDNEACVGCKAFSCSCTDELLIISRGTTTCPSGIVFDEQTNTISFRVSLREGFKSKTIDAKKPIIAKVSIFSTTMSSQCGPLDCWTSACRIVSKNTIYAETDPEAEHQAGSEPVQVEQFRLTD